MGAEPTLTELLMVGQRHVARCAGAALEEEGLTVDQWRILRVLSSGSGHAMGELAEAVALPNPTLTRLMDQLVDLGLVYRRQEAQDRRRMQVHLSRQGRTRLVRLNALVAAAEDAFRRTEQWAELRAAMQPHLPAPTAPALGPRTVDRTHADRVAAALEDDELARRPEHGR